MSDVVIRVKNVSKKYKLGQIGGGTLSGDLQSLWAKIRGKEDPNSKIDDKKVLDGADFFALDNISFEVRKGERVGIIGHNGAGKSTLLKLLSRVTTPSSGVIEYKGRIASMLEVGTGFHPELTGRENVYLNGAILGMNKEEISKKFDAIVKFAEMEKFIDTPVKRFSSGMYVKLAFAVAAHLDSDILIMDEVLAVGDMKFQEKCLGKMDNVSKNEGRTILYVSHNMNTIRQLCDRCIVMDHGKIVFDGDVEKAISIYLGKVTLSNVYIDLSKLEREKMFNNSFIKFQFIQLISKKTSSFYFGEKMLLRVVVYSEKDFNNLYLRLNVKSSDGVPVTMITTNEPVSVHTGFNEFDLKIDISHLIPSRYCFDLISFYLNEFKTGDNLDVVRDALSFDIMPTSGFNNNMQWDPKRFGYTFFDYITFLNKGENQE